MAKYSVDVSEPAENDLRDIVRYISAQLSAPKTALKMMDTIEEAVTGLADMPQPDTLFIAASRLDIITEDYIKGAPDLVVEVLFRSTASYDKVKKSKMYYAHGVKEYWIVDPDAKEQPPADSFDSFLQAAKLGLFSVEFAKKFAPSTEERNIIVHEYEKIDDALVYHSIREALSMYRQ